MTRLCALEHVPHVVSAQVAALEGHAVVCLPDDEEADAAMVSVSLHGLSVNVHMVAGQLVDLAEALLDAIERLNDRRRCGNESLENRVKP